MMKRKRSLLEKAKEAIGKINEYGKKLAEDEEKLNPKYK